MKEAIGWILFGIIIIVSMGFLGKLVADKNEVVECHKWQEQAVQFSGFYLVQWQADQCSQHDIIINAPVK